MSKSKCNGLFSVKVDGSLTSLRQLCFTFFAHKKPREEERLTSSHTQEMKYHYNSNYFLNTFSLRESKFCIFTVIKSKTFAWAVRGRKKTWTFVRCPTKIKSFLCRVATCCLYYHKDRLKNSVFLSPSVCTKRSILFGRRNSTDAVYKTIPS